MLSTVNPSAGVAKSGLRRGAQDPVAKAFVGSNPTSRTKLLIRRQKELSEDTTPDEMAVRRCLRLHISRLLRGYCSVPKM